MVSNAMPADWGVLGWLAARVAAGDSAAESTFRARLQPALAQAAQRALSTAADTSPLAVRIRALARQVTPFPARLARAAREELFGQVAQALCETVVRRLRQERSGEFVLGELL